jgi:hypothetical protein
MYRLRAPILYNAPMKITKSTLVLGVLVLAAGTLSVWIYLDNHPLAFSGSKVPQTRLRLVSYPSNNPLANQHIVFTSTNGAVCIQAKDCPVNYKRVDTHTDGGGYFTVPSDTVQPKMEVAQETSAHHWVTVAHANRQGMDDAPGDPARIVTHWIVTN